MFIGVGHPNAGFFSGFLPVGFIAFIYVMELDMKNLLIFALIPGSVATLLLTAIWTLFLKFASGRK